MMATLRPMQNQKATTVIQTMIRMQRKAIVTSTPVYDESNNLLCFFVEVRDLIKYEQAMTIKDTEEEEVQESPGPAREPFIEVQHPVIVKDPKMLSLMGIAHLLGDSESEEEEVQVESLSPAIISTGPLKERVDQCEKEIIRETLRRHPYKRDAARELGIDTGFRTEECRKHLVEGLSELGVDISRANLFLTHTHTD